MLPLEAPRGRTPAFDSKRLHLLDAAARVFSEVGYDRASMRRVAAEAQLSLAGVYHYVASKEELLYWIQVHTFDSLLRGLEAGVQDLDDPRERLAAAVRNHVLHFGRHMAELKVCARELDTLAGDAYDQVYERRRAYFEAVHELIRKLRPAQGAGLDPWIATASLFGMLNWLYQWYNPASTQVGLDHLAAQQTALFLDGYAASGANKRGNE